MIEAPEGTVVQRCRYCRTWFVMAAGVPATTYTTADPFPPAYAEVTQRGAPVHVCHNGAPAPRDTSTTPTQPATEGAA